MFESTVEKFAKTIGEDLYRPVPSLAASHDCQLFSVVERQASKWWFRKDKRFMTEFSLANILIGDMPKIDVEPTRPLCSFNKTATLNLSGKFCAHFKELFEAELDDVDDVTITANLGDIVVDGLCVQSLLDSIQKSDRKIDLNHELVREIGQKKRSALCIVTALAKTVKDSTITATLNVNASADVKAQLAAIPLGEISGSIQDNKNRSLTIPAGTVLVYQVVELAISDTGSVRVLVGHNSRGGFGFTDVVDSSHNQLLDVKVQSLYKGLEKVTAADLAALLSEIQSVCPNIRPLALLSQRLSSGSADGGSITPTFDKIVLRVNSYSREDRGVIASSICALIKAVKDLDQETLTLLPELSVGQGKEVLTILHSFQSGSSLTAEDSTVQDILTSDSISLQLLTEGLLCSVQGKVLVPPPNSTSRLAAAYVTFYGLFFFR